MPTEKVVRYDVVPRTVPTVRLANLKPMHDRLLCQRIPMPIDSQVTNLGQEHLQIEAGAKVSGLIIAPDCAQKTDCIGSFLRTKDKSCRGVVLRVGPGKRDEDGNRVPCETKPGDVVWWGPYIDLEDGDLVLIQEADVRYVEDSNQAEAIKFSVGLFDGILS